MTVCVCVCANHALQSEDAGVPHLVHSLRKCIDACLPSAPKEIRLRRFVAQSYMGLFLEEEAASWFRELAKNCASDIKKYGGWGWWEDGWVGLGYGGGRL